jgi:hypothetical protein
LAPKSCEKDLSQTGAVFPIEESWISKSFLLKLPEKNWHQTQKKKSPEKTCHLPSLKDSHSQTELQKKHDWILEKSQKYWVYPEPNHKKSQR